MNRLSSDYTPLADRRQAEARDQAHSNAAAARTAIREYLRHARRMRLIELSDVVEMDDNWRELEARELDEHNGGTSPGPH